MSLLVPGLLCSCNQPWQGQLWNKNSFPHALRFSVSKKGYGEISYLLGRFHLYYFKSNSLFVVIFHRAVARSAIGRPMCCCSAFFLVANTEPYTYAHARSSVSLARWDQISGREGRGHIITIISKCVCWALITHLIQVAAFEAVLF